LFGKENGYVGAEKKVHYTCAEQERWVLGGTVLTRVTKTERTSRRGKVRREGVSGGSKTHPKKKNGVETTRGEKGRKEWGRLVG